MLCLLISFSFLDWVIHLVYVLTGQEIFFEHQSPIKQMHRLSLNSHVDKEGVGG